MAYSVRMTGVVHGIRNVARAGLFAASVASYGEWPLFFLLGIIASLSFEVGALFKPAARRETREVVVSQNVSIDACSEGLVVVVPVFLQERAYADVLCLQEMVTSLARDSAVDAIVIVDDASPTPVVLDHCFVVRHESNAGPAAARNTGMRLALASGASTIVFTDADCVPGKGWAQTHRELQRKSPGVWAGRTVAVASDTVSRFHDAVGTLMPREMIGSERVALYGPTCNLSVSKEVASQVTFDEEFPSSAFEDVDFCVRASSLGHETKLSDGAVVFHRFETSLFGLVRQFYKYGRSLPLMEEKHTEYGAMLAVSKPMRGSVLL